MYGKLEEWNQRGRRHIDEVNQMYGKYIDRLDIGRRVLIVNWKTKTRLMKKSHMIDWYLTNDFPIIITWLKGRSYSRRSLLDVKVKSLTATSNRRSGK